MYIRTTKGEIVNSAFMQHIYIASRKDKLDENGVWKDTFHVEAAMNMAPSVSIASGLPTEKDAQALVDKIWATLARESQLPNADHVIFDAKYAVQMK